MADYNNQNLEEQIANKKAETRSKNEPFEAIKDPIVQNIFARLLKRMDSLSNDIQEELDTFSALPVSKANLHAEELNKIVPISNLINKDDSR